MQHSNIMNNVYLLISFINLSTLQQVLQNLLPRHLNKAIYKSRTGLTINVEGHMITESALGAGHPICMMFNDNSTMPSDGIHTDSTDILIIYQKSANANGIV